MESLQNIHNNEVTYKIFSTKELGRFLSDSALFLVHLAAKYSSEKSYVRFSGIGRGILEQSLEMIVRDLQEMICKRELHPTLSAKNAERMGPRLYRHIR